MKRSNRLVILVGVLLAVLAFVGIVILLNSRPTGPGGSGEVTTVTVIVAKEAIAIGDPVTPEKAETKQLEAEAVEQTRILDPSQLTGKPALVPIQAGEQITMEKAGLGTSLVNNVQAQLKPGEKAVAFQVDAVTGLNFLISPGDHIDVVIAQDVVPIQQTADSVTEQRTNPRAPARYEGVTGLANARTVKTILQDRRVLYVSGTNIPQAPVPGASAEDAQAAPPPSTVIIVFAGNDQDAELIKFSQAAVGSLTAVLRRTADTDEGVKDPKTTGITLDLLVEKYAVPIPDIIVLATQGPKRNR